MMAFKCFCFLDTNKYHTVTFQVLDMYAIASFGQKHTKFLHTCEPPQEDYFRVFLAISLYYCLRVNILLVVALQP